MRLPARGSRRAWVTSILWRAFGWLLVLPVLVCAIGGWGLQDAGPLMRLGAIAVAVFFVYVMVRFEMMLWSVGRLDKARPQAEPDSGSAERR
jgi:hypothetical protein